MTDEKLPHLRSNAERHRRTMTPVRNAIACVKAAIKEQDGLEWAGRLQEALECLEEVQRRLPYYAQQ